MGPFIESYRAELELRGYTPQTVRGLLQHVGALGRWMAASDIELADLDVTVLESFLEHRRSSGRTHVRTTRSLSSLLDHLRDLGVVPPEQPAPVDPLLAEYRSWMVGDRGLAPSTIRRNLERCWRSACGCWSLALAPCRCRAVFAEATGELIAEGFVVAAEFCEFESEGLELSSE